MPEFFEVSAMFKICVILLRAIHPSYRFSILSENENNLTNKVIQIYIVKNLNSLKEIIFV